MSAWLKIVLPYSLFLGMAVAVWISCRDRRDDAAVIALPESAEQTASAPAPAEPFDPVCHMEVNPHWGYAAQYHGKSYSFCTQACRDHFIADPERYLRQRCLVCELPVEPATSFAATYLGKTYHLCCEEHRRQFKADPATFFMHTMWGTPPWMYYTSIAVVLIVSFGLFEWIDRVRGAITSAGVTSGVDRINLLQNGIVRRLATSRVFRFLLQAVIVGLFFLIIAAGLFGNQNPALNIAPLLTWTVWWGGLVILIMFAGKAWCYVCPWDAVAGWMEKLRLWRPAAEGLGLNLKWPAAFRNILLATLLFVGLTWVELGFGVTMKPRITAYLGITMLLMAIVSAFLFQRKGFCRYACLVGRVSGLYALFSGVEIRSRDAQVCKDCRGKECVRGSETAYGCPTFLYPGGMTANTYCIQCTECLQACPHDNLALNLRPWGADLANQTRPRTDEAYLALLMLSITGFHGLTMTPNWAQLTDWLAGSLSLGKLLSFSAGMALIMLAPIAVYALLVAASHRLAGTASERLSYRDYFVRYAYALLPIALFYHLAHNLEHLLMEGPKVVGLISDPFGWGWNLFGTLDWSVPPLVSLDVLWVLQIALVLVGHVYSLWVAQRTSVRLFGDRGAAFRSQLPMLVAMICFSVFSLWLLKQPMEMRTSAM
jgi:YHS domain-containing protein